MEKRPWSEAGIVYPVGSWCPGKSLTLSGKSCTEVLEAVRKSLRSQNLTSSSTKHGRQDLPSEFTALWAGLSEVK